MEFSRVAHSLAPSPETLPDSHCLQVDNLEIVLKYPEGQSLQAEEVEGEKRPGTQSMQNVLPLCVASAPAAQDTQAVLLRLLCE